MKPVCMDIAEYEAWRQQNESLYTKTDRAETPCDDCLASHALEMRAENKCLVWDGYQYVLGRPRGYEQDGDVRRMTKQEAALYAARLKASRRTAAIKEAMRLKHEGMTAKEVGERMGVTTYCVYRYWHDARRMAA